MQDDKDIDERSVSNHQETLDLKGLKDISDTEYLQKVIQFAYPRQTDDKLAKKLMDEYGILSNIFLASKEQLLQFDGVNEHIAHYLITMRKAKYRATDKRLKIDYANAPLDFIIIFEPYLEGAIAEKMFIAYLDEKHRVIAVDLHAIGTTQSVTINFRKVLESVIKYGAKYVALAHNHPRSDNKPSKDDILSTERLKNTLSLMGVTLIDHIIFGMNGCRSIINCKITNTNDLKN